MPISALFLVIAAAFIHATWNLLGKRAAHLGATFVTAYTAVACCVYLPWVAFVIWRGRIEWSAPVLLCIALSGLLHLGYNLSLLHGYRVADLSVVYPVARGSAPLMSSLAAFALFAEPPTGLKLLGIAGVVGGVALISLTARSAQAGSSTLRGVRWGATTGALIAGYTLVDAWGVKRLALEPVVLNWCTDLFRLGLLVPWLLTRAPRARQPLGGSWRLAIAIGVLAPCSYILVLAALQHGGQVSLIAPAREMSMMIGALLGMLLLREPLGVTRFAGCVCLLSGVILLTAS
jgi:drug/metabolite transporter (DMT)-like permease